MHFMTSSPTKWDRHSTNERFQKALAMVTGCWCKLTLIRLMSFATHQKIDHKDDFVHVILHVKVSSLLLSQPALGLTLCHIPSSQFAFEA